MRPASRNGHAMRRMLPASSSLTADPGDPSWADQLPDPLPPNPSPSQAAQLRRSRALAPYLVAAPKRGVIGNSPYADRLRKGIVGAARDESRRPVMVFGERGLEKANIASLIHFGGPSRQQLMVSIGAGRLDPGGTELFGRGGKDGLLDLLQAQGGGTLNINDVQQLPPALIPRLQQLLRDGTYQHQAVPQGAPDPSLDPSSPAPEALEAAESLRRAPDVRIVMTAERPCPLLEQQCTVIKVPPLRLRPGDVKDYAKYFLALVNAQNGAADGGAGPAAPGAAVAAQPRARVLTAEAVKRLQSYTWPGNITELEAQVVRAAVVGVSSGKALPEEVFWSATQGKDRFRWNLLSSYPLLKQLLRSELWPDAINFKFTAYVYPVLVALLLWGPQDREHNFVLSFFWAWWWPLSFVAFILLGRVWCAVCPFMIYGELVQRWRLASGATLLKWPRELGEEYGPWFLFALFAAILVWEEVWDLPHSAALSGWLLLLITAGAVACSAVFERRFWCRYLCPIGGMNGMFAKLAVTELRARQGVCSGECSTYHCYKGGCAQPPEGLESPGCPLYSHPAQLVDNKHCVNCMECLKACPNSSVEFRLRPPGIELWTTHKPSAPELALLFLLLGAVYLHDLPQLALQLGLPLPSLGAVGLPSPEGAESATPWVQGVTWRHIASSLAVLGVPGALAWATDVLLVRSGWVRRASAAAAGTAWSAAAAAVGLTTSQQQMATAGGPGPTSPLPAAPSLAAGAGQSSSLAAVATSAPHRTPPPPAPFLQLAYGYMPLCWAATLVHYLPPLLTEAGSILPILAATAGWEDAPLPALWAAHPAVIAFLQGSTLLVGLGASLVLTRRVACQPWLSIWPHCLLMTALSLELWRLEGI